MRAGFTQFILPTYTYKVRNRENRELSGEISSESRDKLLEVLQKQGLLPISIQEKKEKPIQIANRFEWVSTKELEVFTRQMAILSDTGLTITQCLDSSLFQVKSKLLARIIREAKQEIEVGRSLSHGLKKYPHIFPRIYTGMIEAGEQCGNLSELLNRLSEIIEYENNIKAQIKSATRYPMIVLGALVLAFIILILFVIPRFAMIYGGLGAILPLPTRILIWFNTTLTKNMLLTIFTVAATVGVFFYITRKTIKGRYYWHKLIISMPVFGQIAVKINTARFAMLFRCLTQSGITIMESLELIHNSFENELFRQEIEKARRMVGEGRSLSVPFQQSKIFPPVVAQMLQAGERTGTIEEMMASVDKYFNKEIEYTLKNLLSYIEPVLIFVMGMLVLFVALGIFLPMWSMMDAFKYGSAR